MRIFGKQGKLDSAAKMLVDEGQICIRLSLALVLDRLALRRLQLERRESLDALRLHDLGILIR